MSKVFLNSDMNRDEELDQDGTPMDDCELAKKVRAIMKEKNYKISYEEAWEILLEREKELEEGEEDVGLAEKVRAIEFQEGCSYEEAWERLCERGED